MRVAVGSDEGCALSEAVFEALSEKGHEVVLVGGGSQWPEVGRGVASVGAAGEVGAGVVMCLTGTGVSMVADKVVGVRAALCADPETAPGARRWSDADALALSIRATGVPLAKEILFAYRETAPYEAEGLCGERIEISPTGAQ